MPRGLNTHHLERLAEYGYLIIPEYYAGPQPKEIQATQWENPSHLGESERYPPANRAILTDISSS